MTSHECNFQHPRQFPILSTQISKHKINCKIHSFAARKLKLCTWTNFRVENSFPVLAFRILENLTTCCDVISHKFRQTREKHAFLHKMVLENPRNTKTCTWTNIGMKNSFSLLVFRILENLTTCGDIIFHTFRQ